MRGQQGCEFVVPTVHEVQATLLHPTVEVSRRNLIGGGEDAVLRGEDLDWRLFHRDAPAAQRGWIGSEMAAVEVADVGLVLRQQSSSRRNKIKQLLIVHGHFLPRIVGADAEHDRVEFG